MAAGISDYLDSSDRLLTTAQRFSSSIGNSRYRDLAAADLLAAVENPSGRTAQRSFENEARTPNAAARVDPENLLAAALFDLQSSSVLISAGLMLNESGVYRGPAELGQALQEISENSATLAQPPTPRFFLRLRGSYQPILAPRRKPSAPTLTMP